MNKVMRIESSHVIAVLEATVAALELAATLPDNASDVVAAALAPAARQALERHVALEAAVLTDTPTRLLEERPEVDTNEANDTMAAFPASFHRILQLLTHDKPTRDALRRSSATRVSPSFTHFVLAWTQLVMHVERSLSTSPEQDALAVTSVRESKLRLRDTEDDRQQVAFELTQATNARAAMTDRFAKTITALQEQLQDTQQRADEALATTSRSREQELHTALSAFENQSTTANEKALAVARLETRASDEHKQLEADERKRTQRVTTDVHELHVQHAIHIATLDTAIAAVGCEIKSIARATAALVEHFGRVDDDKRHQLDELRAINDATRQKHQRELNLFRFIPKLQAVVRGFLVRRQHHLELQQLRALRQQRKTKKKKKKQATGKTKVTGRATQRAVGSAKATNPSKRTGKSPRKSAATKTAARPTSARDSKSLRKQTR